MNKLLKNSISHLVTTINNNGSFKYELLNSQKDFLKTHRNSAIRRIKEFELKIRETDEVAKFEHFLQPNDKNIAKILNGINSKGINSIPIPGASKQEKSNYVIEQFFYDKFKPLKLLDNIQKFNHIKSTSNTTFKIMDITNPVEWFPNARKMKRKIIMHVGPTNSGKTYNALKKLENCHTGYYAGPLRLLAREIYEKFQLKKIRCNLLTGEEVEPDIDQFGNISGLTSGTIEMISLNDQYDVVVLDEIQMISNPSRGWAWTNVVLGCQLKELHLCGEASAVPLIKEIAKLTGDDIEIHEYDRLGALKVSEFPITQLEDFRKGDCIVAFSKKKILDIKLFLESKTNFKCGVIYGALPPETRTGEANKFNNGEYDLLVASDAVGMGLNLKINRIVFTNLSKFDGNRLQDLSSSQIKQIGGRAGRFGMNKNGEGYITAIDTSKLEIVEKNMNGPIQYLTQLALWMPSFLWLKYFSMFPSNTKLIHIFERFETDLEELKRKTGPTDSSLFFISELDDVKQVSKFFDEFNLLKGFLILDQMKVVNLPVNLNFEKNANRITPYDQKSDYITREFVDVLKSRATKSIINFNTLLDLYNTSLSQYKSLFEFKKSDTYSLQLLNLNKLEVLHKLIMLYLWLSYRYPKSFIDYESVLELKNMTELKITKELDELRNDRLKRNEFLFD